MTRLITSQIRYVSISLHVYLRFQEQGIKSVEEEFPGENLPVAKGVVELIEGLQDHGTVNYHQIKLGLKAHYQTLKKKVIFNSLTCLQGI